MYKTQFHKYRVPWVNYTKLNFINIEFHMKFFIEKSHVTWHFLFTKLEINKIEFYAKSSSKMVVFWYIVYLPIMLFCWKFLKCDILFGQYSSCVSNMSISKVQNFDLMSIYVIATLLARFNYLWWMCLSGFSFHSSWVHFVLYLRWETVTCAM